MMQQDSAASEGTGRTTTTTTTTATQNTDTTLTLVPCAASQGLPRLRITVYPNAATEGGKIVVVPATWTLLLGLVVRKLKLACHDTSLVRLFLGNGGEVEDVDELQDQDVVYAVLPGETFQRVSATASSSVIADKGKHAADAATVPVPSMPSDSSGSNDDAGVGGRDETSPGIEGEHDVDEEGDDIDVVDDDGNGEQDTVDRDIDYTHDFDAFAAAVSAAIERHGAAQGAAGMHSAKLRLINMVAGHVGQDARLYQSQDAARRTLIRVVVRFVRHDAEFLLKLALYLRREAGSRTTALFLLALAAHIKPCQSYLAAYYRYIVRTPSDWLDVAQLYHTVPNQRLAGRSFPSSLRAVMVARFAQFDEYQLAKHDNRQREKRRARRRQALMQRLQYDLEYAAAYYAEHADDEADVFADAAAAAHATGPARVTLKSMIRRLHISKPRHLVMAVIGARYPASRDAFRASGLSGTWDRTRAGQRMRLATPMTWETQLVQRGNTAATWEALIAQDRLGITALLRNLSNIIRTGVSSHAYRHIARRLRTPAAIRATGLSPMRFLSAAQAVRAVSLPMLSSLARSAGTINSRRVRTSPHRYVRSLPIGHQGRRGRLPLVPSRVPVHSDIKRVLDAIDDAFYLSIIHCCPAFGGNVCVLVDVGKHMRRAGAKASVMREGHLAALLLALIVRFRSVPSCSVVLFGARDGATVHLPAAATSGSSIDRAIQAAEAAAQAAALNTGSGFPLAWFTHAMETGRRFHRLVIISSDLTYDNATPAVVDMTLAKYRSRVAPRCVIGYVDVFGSAGSTLPSVNGHVSGASGAVLSSLAEMTHGESGKMKQLWQVQTIRTRLGLEEADARAAERGAAEAQARADAAEARAAAQAEAERDAAWERMIASKTRVVTVGDIDFSVEPVDANGRPRVLVCPITDDVFDHPVWAADGHVYERDALAAWLRVCAISPVTGTSLDPDAAVSVAWRVKRGVERWRSRTRHI